VRFGFDDGEMPCHWHLMSLVGGAMSGTLA
jgi:hypothetical protein